MKMLYAALIVFMISCQTDNQSESKTKQSMTPADETGILVADPIVYEVFLKNSDTTDLFKTESLEGLDRELLIKSIFDDVYAGKLAALDFFNEDTLTVEEIREIKSRDSEIQNAIEKIQFSETWSYNSDTRQFVKSVTQMTFGYPRYIDDTVKVGYNPVFKINFD